MSGTTAQHALHDALVEHGWILPSGVSGVFGRSAAFEAVAQGVQRAVGAAGRAIDPDPQWVHFPPVLAREILRRTGYMENFPNLCGSVHSFAGQAAEHEALAGRVRDGGDWGEFLTQADVALCPAACYPLFPTLAGTTVPLTRTFALTTWVFRNEPSEDPARMRAFRQHEHVFVGGAEQVQAWRRRWMQTGRELLASLGLPVRLEAANDMFFGRGGRMMKATQREQGLKHELVVPITSDEHPTAVASFNDHQDHYGSTFGFRAGPSGETAHTACFGFGLERVTIALLRTHGMDLEAWPGEVRGRLLP